ncbi:MAG: hypothetical protein JWN76_944 [Chitinophagaceae bacterium]|nr:hypothetical protein [Chitinophagaceae bacterium]
MKVLKQLYLNFYLVVFALYVYFDKGIAYTYLAEFLFATGMILILANIRSFEFTWDKRLLVLVLFLVISVIYIVRGIGGYALMDVIRDSFVLNYILFAFIIFLFKDDLEYFKEKIFQVYKWYPVVECCLFLLLSYSPFFAELKVFGGINILLYKYGDMSVHLFISAILLLNGYIKVTRRHFILNAILIVYLYFIVAAFSRAGMLEFALSFALFFYFSKDKELKARFRSYLKYLPLAALLALPVYLVTNVGENGQGRKLGLEQLKENATSIFSSGNGGTLEDNKVWRLVWWSKIIDYTFGGEYFLDGKGLGMSLATDDNITTDEEGDLRSPHNFHMTILARFGVPIFLLWIYWLCLTFRDLWSKKTGSFKLIILVIAFIFIFNASFDVFLEGPMGAFPFWTFLGLGYADEAFGNETKQETADADR